MFGEHRSEGMVEDHQTIGQRHLGVGPDLPVGDMAQPVAVRPDDAPTGAAKPGVEADQDQPSFSIT
jgi:hypothetical protein